MKYHLVFLIFSLFFAPTFAFGACSVANLTRCLDSACAININANPAARCQYCGSSAAGTPAKSTAMKSISAGSSAKYNISDKDLKKAPSDPGERYVWATRICLEKVSGCTAEDVSDNYDSLIEKSCTAAGISAQMSNLIEKSNKQKGQTECSNEISVCLVNDKHCLADYTQCESDADFDKHFSDCAVAATGCDSFTKDIRSKLIAARDTAIKTGDEILERIVSAYQTAREKKLNGAQQSCKDNSSYKKCVAMVCDTNMPHKCDDKHTYEETLANQLCEFHKIACTRLK